LIIGIGGRSCSGKGVVSDIASVNYRVLHIDADIFFKAEIFCEYKGYHCLECVNSIRWDDLVDTLTNLKCGRGATIEDKRFWRNAPPYKVEIHPDDVHERDLILIEGYLLFTQKRVLELLDAKIFIDVSDENMLYRRLMREGKAKFNYIHEVVIPVSKKYEAKQKTNADRIIDGNLTQKAVAEDLTSYINEILAKKGGNFSLGLPQKQPPWTAHSYDLMADHAWHPIDLGNLKDWVRTERNLNALECGQELFGNTFRYRRNRNYGTYEVRLGENHLMYRYEPKPT